MHKSHILFLGFGVGVSLHACSSSVTGADAPDSSTVVLDVSVAADAIIWNEDIRADINDVSDVLIMDRQTIADRPEPPQERTFARLDLIRTPRRSNEIDSVEAWIVVPQRLDGTGYRAQRSGECVVENLTYPPFDRFADRLFFSVGATEREVNFRDILQTMRWSALDHPFLDVSEVTFRAVRSDFAVPWTFTASIPPPMLQFTSPAGIEQLPMPALNLRLTDTVVFRWTPNALNPLVQIQFETNIVSPDPTPYARSNLRCIYDGMLGTASIRLADHPAWRNRPNFRSGVVLDVDALAQHIVPYGDVTVEVNMMHRYGAFGVSIDPSP